MTVSNKNVLTFTLMVLVAALFLGLSSPVMAGSKDKVQHAQLMPWGAGGAGYPDATAKLTRNCDTGEVILRGHGLTAGSAYELRSGGDLPGDPEVAVGSGKTGKGNNVLIKDIKEDDSGKFWNLWEGETRIMRAPKVACS